MSNFTVNGVYSYTSANLYSYLGRVPTNSAALERAFDDFDITPTGKTDDLKKLNNHQAVPWASLCAQIGIQATGDYDKDYAAFNNAIQLLSQSAIDGQAMTYFAGLRSEAQQAFGLTNRPAAQDAPITYPTYQAQFMSSVLGRLYRGLAALLVFPL